MRTNASSARSTLIVLAVAAIATVAPRAQSTDVTWLLARVGERVAEYYKRAQNIICTEKVLAQQMDFNYNSAGFGRTLEYELHLESEAADGDGAVHEAKIARELRKVNGRTPRPNDKDGCFDPETREPEPLTFLLPVNQREYTFTSAVFGKGKDSRTLVIDFLHKQNGKPEIKLPVTTKGRVWVDAVTFDVVRVEEELATRIDVRVPYEQQRRMNLPDFITIDRYQTITKYTVVKFSDPDEALLLPESIEEVALMRGAGSHRKRQQFSDYRRFLTGGRILKDPGAE
jgi:hypothetical protein